MKYLGYYESLEGARFEIYNTLDEAKRPWCFKLAIFEVPDSFTQEELISIPKPRFPYFCNHFDISEGLNVVIKDISTTSESKLKVEFFIYSK